MEINSNNRNYVAKASGYLTAMKTMCNLEKMVDAVRPDKYKAICQKHGIKEKEAMVMYSFLQKTKTDYFLANCKVPEIKRALAIGEEAYTIYAKDSFAHYVDMYPSRDRQNNILVSFRKGEETIHQEFDLSNTKTFLAVTDMMNSGFQVESVVQQVDNIESSNYKGPNEEKKSYIPIYDGDVILCYKDDTDSFFTSYEDCGLYLCQCGAYYRLVYNPGKGYVRHGEPDTDEDFELDIDNNSFSKYMLTISKYYRKLGNIHSGIGFLIESNNNGKEEKS